MNDEKPHPWGTFLNARYNAILWMRDNRGYDDKTIAENLSMDEAQVFMIRTRQHMPIPVGKNELP